MREYVMVSPRAVLAGVLIGIGDVAVMESGNRYIGALLFAVALLSIIRLGLPLYTGRVGTVLQKRNYAACSRILLWNLVGAWIPVILYRSMREDAAENVKAVADLKYSRGIVGLFAAGILCNALVHVAVVAKNEAVTVLCVMCFILCGFEHSIADFPYVCVNLWYIPEWIAVLVGNTAGAVATEALMMRRGNGESGVREGM